VRFRSLAELDALIEHGDPESPSLEYKRELHLGQRSERLEALKDLTAMGNGGGGTIVFGMDETEGDWPLAKEVKPLTDRTLVAKLENMVRDGIRPPLLWDVDVLDVGDHGFVLSVDVMRSPLGPYMVEAYGNRRYHVRVGRRTEEMHEAMVRDAYELAARARDRRAEVWETHALPIAPPSIEQPWIGVAAMPEEPLVDFLDVGHIKPQSFRPDGALARHVSIGNFSVAAQQLRRWADGLFGGDRLDDRPPYSLCRLHRDGAAGVIVCQAPELEITHAARVVNAQLAYISWFWTQIGLARLVEVEIRIDNVAGCTLNTGMWLGSETRVHEPHGVPIHNVVRRDAVPAWDLGRARTRHQIVQRFIDRLYQAFGESTVTPLFRSGQLYRQVDGPLSFSIAGGGVWDSAGRPHGHVHEDGAVRRATDGSLAAWCIDGVLLDLKGDALGVTELAVGHGCPDDFLPSRVADDPRARVPRGDAGRPLPVPEQLEPPTPTGRWSKHTEPLADYFLPSGSAG
jgi:hypothetical protein